MTIAVSNLRGMQHGTHRDKRPYEVLVWGATGFTGQLVVEYLLERYPPGDSLRWAIGGRNADKLQQLLDRLIPRGERPAIERADSHDLAGLTRMAGKSRVVVSTVGPYAQHGSELVEACVSRGTHYCDLAGEPHWIRQMIDRHHADAVASGARIVPSCGFDSIPSDMGVWFLQQHAIATHGRPCEHVSLLVRAAKGGASGGTVASLLNVLAEAADNRDVASIVADPYCLNPPGQRHGPDGRDQREVAFNQDAGVWTAPFVMAVINTRVVRRSNALLDYAYGKAFRYDEAVMAGKGIAGWAKAAAIAVTTGGLALAGSTELVRKQVLGRLLPSPGQGPNREQRENGYFNLRLYGRLDDGSLLQARVTGDRDPGYGSTSRMLGESAVCLARDNLEVGGGFWTPASAMGGKLLGRLQAGAGMRFEIII